MSKEISLPDRLYTYTVNITYVLYKGVALSASEDG